ncbi:MAG: ankyrin repeat domain-containing protein [Zavarzinella sp.]
MSTSDGFLAMYDAHERGDLDAVQNLLKSHPELEERGPEDNTHTWLHFAAQMGHISLAKFWLDQGHNVNRNVRGSSPKKDGLYTPLHLAKDAAMTRFLLSQGASVNACARIFGTPLHNAISLAVEPSRQRCPQGANMDQIHALLEAGTDLFLMNGEDKGYTPLAWAIKLKRKTAENLLREVDAPEKGRSAFTRKKVLKLDLRKDYDQIYKLVVKRVQKYNPRMNVGTGDESSLVHMIELGYQCDQAGWVALIFDTRPDAAPDGEWTASIGENLFERRHWHEAYQAIQDGPVQISLPDGTQCEIGATEYESFTEKIGEMLKNLLLKARTDGVFESLPKAIQCHLGVEAIDGSYGWPAYEDRGKDDLV